jgi:hypothetical protein
MGAIHTLHKLSRIGRKGLNIPALSLRVKGVKSERRFAGPTQSRNRRDAVQGDLKIEILQVVLPGSGDTYDRGVHFFFRLFVQSELLQKGDHESWLSLPTFAASIGPWIGLGRKRQIRQVGRYESEHIDVNSYNAQHRILK